MTLAHPLARVVAMHTDGHRVDRVAVQCVWCGSTHWHAWHDEADGVRAPTCGALGSYEVRIGPKERIDHMREGATPDSVIGLVPLHIGYAFEVDGDVDIIAMVMSTTLGEFAVWLPAESALQLAGQLVEIVENKAMLRRCYLERAENGHQIAVGAANAAGVG